MTLQILNMASHDFRISGISFKKNASGTFARNACSQTRNRQQRLCSASSQTMNILLQWNRAAKIQTVANTPPGTLGPAKKWKHTLRQCQLQLPLTGKASSLMDWATQSPFPIGWSAATKLPLCCPIRPPKPWTEGALCCGPGWKIHSPHFRVVGTCAWRTSWGRSQIYSSQGWLLTRLTWLSQLKQLNRSWPNGEARPQLALESCSSDSWLLCSQPLPNDMQWQTALLIPKPSKRLAKDKRLVTSWHNVAMRYRVCERMEMHINPTSRDPSTARWHRFSRRNWWSRLNAFGFRRDAVEPKVMPEHGLVTKVHGPVTKEMP